MKYIYTSVVFAVMAFVLLSCGKGKGGYDGGSWVFKSTKYQSGYTNFIKHTIVASTVDNLPTGSLLFSYWIPTDVAFIALPNSVKDSLYPKAGTYTVTNTIVTGYDGADLGNTSDSLHMYIILTDSSATRSYTPSPSSTTIVTVTRTAQKITVTVPDVMMVSNDGKDSAILNGTLTQTP